LNQNRKFPIFYIFRKNAAQLIFTGMELKVYPNPADDYIIIETGISQPSTFKLFDMIGKMVFFGEVADKERLSIKELEEGMYYYKLVADSRLQAGKLRLNRE
jgi:hypothetical protein